MEEYCFLKKGYLYYMADYCGYTENVARAGLYEKSVAEAYEADSAANANGATVAVPVSKCPWTVTELNDQINTLIIIRDAKEASIMEETFTMLCNHCGKDYQASRDAVYSPIQICRRCAEEMYKQTPVASVTVGQKFVPKDGTPYRALRVVSINGLFVELERCEHHEGLTHETFPMHIERLLRECIPEDNK